MKITELKGIGEKTGKLFQKLGIDVVEDLVSFYPRTYEQYSPPVIPDDSCLDNVIAVDAVISSNITTRHVRSLSITNMIVTCNGIQIYITYFNMPYLSKTLHQNDRFVFRGLLQKKGNRLIMEQPKNFTCEVYAEMTGRLLPIYSTTKGISQSTLSKAVKQAINLISLDEYLPDIIVEKYHFLSREKSIEQIHFPDNADSLMLARNRLVFEEFFCFLLMVKEMKETNSQTTNSHPMIEVSDTTRLLEALPYELTSAQKKVWSEIQNDLTSEHVMNRLIQGDVGSGKTILAFLSMLMCASNGYQSALMAPTEVLATQHFESLKQLIDCYHLPLRPVLLTGSVTPKNKRLLYEEIENGSANVVIGTHALIQDKVKYKNLALVITDEQHRFGVHQREYFAGKGEAVHVLVMSATPIPRTLAIILYGDLSISVLNELPSNRMAIKNCVVGTSYRQKAYQFMEKEIAAGHQVYVICPMVEESESMDLEDVVNYTKKLKENMSTSVRISYLHGKMKAIEKNRIMEDFAAGKTDILVSTTVIEVGINVPNATVMLIENAERFGLAQLHQLRGRVGRGKEQSYCIFVTKSEKPENQKRLKILNESNDGFYIASKDLQLRGPGDLFGIRQSGDLRFVLGDIYRDSKILQNAAEEADLLMKNDPELTAFENQRLKEHFEQLHTNQVDFIAI